ncbi:MAG: hypothetical protein H7844_14880 [Nitrospirae bacterium YQR-1]
MNVAEKIKELSETIVHNDNFADINNLFLDLAEDPGFHNVSKPEISKKIKDTITTVAKTLVKNAEISDFMSLSIRKHHFWHGCFFTNNRLSTFFYFETLEMGLLAIVKNGGGTDLIRFTASRHSRCIH